MKIVCYVCAKQEKKENGLLNSLAVFRERKKQTYWGRVHKEIS